MENLFVKIEDLIGELPKFYRIQCSTCRETEIYDEVGKLVTKRTTSAGAVLEEISTKSGKYNCKKCMNKILKNPYYDKEVENERIMSQGLS